MVSIDWDARIRLRDELANRYSHEIWFLALLCGSIERAGARANPKKIAQELAASKACKRRPRIQKMLPEILGLIERSNNTKELLGALRERGRTTHEQWVANNSIREHLKAVKRKGTTRKPGAKKRPSRVNPK